VFAAMAVAKGENLKTKALWYQLGTSLGLMLAIRDFIFWLGIF
jgi:hypothetical protein